MNCTGYLYIPDMFRVQTLRMRPGLEGEPFWIDLNGRVLAAAEELEELGVCAGVSSRKAARIAPGAQRLEYRPEDFQCLADLLCTVAYRVTPVVEPFHPGEIFLGVQTQDCEQVARVLLAEVRDLGFEGVVGVAHSRLGARLLGRRLAANQKKRARAAGAPCPPGKAAPASSAPKRFARLEMDQHADFIAPYPVDALWTLPGRLREHLKRLGMLRVAHLQRFHRQALVCRFGQDGYALFEAARGLDTRPLHSAWPPKTVSVRRHYEDLRNREVILQQLSELCMELSDELKSRHHQCRKLHVEVLEEGCIMPVSDVMVISPPACSPNRLRICAARLFERMRLTRSVEAIRITAEDLVTAGARQLDLFTPLRALDGQKEELKAFLTVRFGAQTLRFCSDVAVAWRERMLRFY